MRFYTSRLSFRANAKNPLLISLAISKERIDWEIHFCIIPMNFSSFVSLWIEITKTYKIFYFIQNNITKNFSIYIILCHTPLFDTKNFWILPVNNWDNFNFHIKIHYYCEFHYFSELLDNKIHYFYKNSLFHRKCEKICFLKILDYT